MLRRLLAIPDRDGSTASGWARPVRLLSGAVFLLAGIAKFAAHSAEVDAFSSYGLPAPAAFVALIGCLEIAGGILLLAGLATRPAALILVGVMVGAIVVSGIAEGEVIPSLTLAPALLAAMLFVLWAGPGAGSLDERLLSRRPEPG
jgi:putative oxidoreductase